MVWGTIDLVVTVFVGPRRVEVWLGNRPGVYVLSVWQCSLYPVCL
jgi:hypothetical protein